MQEFNPQKILLVEDKGNLSDLQKEVLKRCEEEGWVVEPVGTKGPYLGQELSYIWVDDLWPSKDYLFEKSPPHNKPHGPAKYRKGKAKRW